MTASYDEQWHATIAASVMPYQRRFDRGLVQHDHDDELELDARVVAKRPIGWVWGLRQFGIKVGGDVAVTRHDLDVAMPPQPRENVTQLGEPDDRDTSHRFAGIVWTPDAGAWLALVVLIFVVTVFKIGGNIAARPL